MRKSTAAWLSLAALCGALLFRTSQMTTDGAARLAELEAATGREKESIRVLSAEWGYLNAPDRLEKLARAHLDLEAMKGKQFAEAAALGARPVVSEPEKAEAKPEAKPEVKIMKTEAPEAKPSLPEQKKKVAAKKTSAPRTASRELVFPRYVPPGYGAKKAQPSYNQKPQPYKAQPAYSQKTQPPAPRPQQQQRRGFGDLMKSLGAD